MSVVATFEIEYLQYMDADGKLVRDDLPDFAKDVKQLVELYKMMSFVRVFDTQVDRAAAHRQARHVRLVPGP